MVIFDQLRISDDGQTLFINVHINKASYFDDLYIKKITICTEDQVHETDPLEYFDEFIYQQDFQKEDLKELHLVLNSNSLNEVFKGKDLSHNMFFVYIECGGTPDPCTPCRLDELTTLGVTFDYGRLFNIAMNYTRELAKTCNIPDRFIDFILNFEGLKVAIETEHYIPAINYWNTLTEGANYSTTTKPCGCHG